MAPLPYLSGLGEIERRGADLPVWMLLVDSPLLEADVVQRLTERVVSAHRDFNFHRIECGRDTSASACMGLAEEFPIGASHRLVWLRNAHLLDDREKQRLAEYLPQAPPSTVFLISVGKGAADNDDEGPRSAARAGSKKLLDAATKVGCVIAGQLDNTQIMGWLERELASHGVKATVEARTAMLTRVGPDLAALRSEAAKLACYLGDRQRLEMADVVAMIMPSPAHRIFDLSDAIAAHDASTALVVLAEFMAADEPPLRILGYLTSHFRNLIKVKALRERGESVERMSALLNKKDWSLKRDIKVVDRLSADELERSVEALLRADQGIKSGKDPRFLMDLLTLTLCQPRPDKGSSGRRNSNKTARNHGD